MFGTNTFNLVWEDVCATVLDDQLHTPLRQLPIPNPGIYANDETLLTIIDKPLWNIDGKDIRASKTLIPDTVTFLAKDNNRFLYIYDAKYYVIRQKDSTISGQPGIESITKQFLYQQAYKKFMNDQEIISARNCFLLPTEELDIVNKGTVTLEFLENLGLEKIQVILLPVNEMYDKYLSASKLDISKYL